MWVTVSAQGYRRKMVSRVLTIGTERTNNPWSTSSFKTHDPTTDIAIARCELDLVGQCSRSITKISCTSSRQLGSIHNASPAVVGTLPIPNPDTEPAAVLRMHHGSASIRISKRKSITLWSVRMPMRHAKRRI